MQSDNTSGYKAMDNWAPESMGHGSGSPRGRNLGMPSKVGEACSSQASQQAHAQVHSLEKVGHVSQKERYLWIFMAAVLVITKKWNHLNARRQEKLGNSYTIEHNEELKSYVSKC